MPFWSYGPNKLPISLPQRRRKNKKYDFIKHLIFDSTATSPREREQTPQGTQRPQSDDWDRESFRANPRSRPASAGAAGRAGRALLSAPSASPNPFCAEATKGFGPSVFSRPREGVGSLSRLTRVPLTASNSGTKLRFARPPPRADTSRGYLVENTAAHRDALGTALANFPELLICAILTS
jgi:hypothetical protein